MSEFCCCAERGKQCCTEYATHRLLIGSREGASIAIEVPEAEHEKVFCETHASLVQRDLQARWAAARATPKVKPSTKRCAVCEAPLVDVWYEISGVGDCCGACQTAAASEAMEAYGQGKAKAKRKRKAIETVRAI